jgi:hypothetical protein
VIEEQDSSLLSVTARPDGALLDENQPAQIGPSEEVSVSQCRRINATLSGDGA